MRVRSLLGCLCLAGVTAAAACGGSPDTSTAPQGSGSDASAGDDGSAGGDDGSTGGMDGAGKHDAADSGGGQGDAGMDAPGEAGPFMPAMHPPWPIVPGNQEVVLDPMKLVTVVASNDAAASTYFAFGDALVASSWWKALSAEYKLGTPSASVHVTGAALTTNPDENAMQSFIASAIAGTAAAAPDGHTMYMLYLPPGIDAVDTMGTNTNCQFYGGYHTPYGTGGDSWGMVQHCPVQGTGLTDTQWMTIGASHEIGEAATDPQPGSGWTFPYPDPSAPWTSNPWAAAVVGELGDMCIETEWTEGGFTYQRMWSDVAAAMEGDPCIPAVSQDAYVNASVPQGWYTITSGGQLTIPVTGFSDEPATDWAITPVVWSSSVTGFQATLTSSTTTTIHGSTYPTTNNGRMATMTVTAPSATSGAWATIALYSIPQGPSPEPYHLWFVGVYVP